MLIFAEPLPQQCPPHDAIDVAFARIQRLVDSDVPGPDAFKSHAALGRKAPKGVDMCRWSSCSLTSDPAKLKKLPAFKDTHHWVAILQIPSGSGKSKAVGYHVDFWCAKEFDMLKSIVEIKRI